MHFDYYDNEIITKIAQNRGLDEDYVRNTLENHEWQEYPITFRSTLGMSSYLQTGAVGLLLEQKKVMEEIAAYGRDCVIVGRNADLILKSYEPFNIFVCAEKEAKIRRCMERAQPGEQLSEKVLLRQMKQIDKVRSQTREFLSGTPWGHRSAYHLTVNTTTWEIKELVPAVAEFAMGWFRRSQ